MSSKTPLPPNLVDSIDDAATLTNDLIIRSATTLGDLAQRWMDGLTYADVDAVTKSLGSHINAFWLKAYTTAEHNVKPGNP